MVWTLPGTVAQHESQNSAPGRNRTAPSAILAAVADSAVPRIHPAVGSDAIDGFAAALAEATPSLQRFLRRRTPTARDAEDLEQETLERAWRYRQSFQDTLEMAPWLRRCALNVWLAWRKREAQRPQLLGETASAIEDPRGSTTEVRDSLAAAMAPLAAIQRDLLLRHHRDRLTIRELATEFDLPENTVKSHLRRARARLARIDHDD